MKAIAVEPWPAGGYRAVASATWNEMLVEVALEAPSRGRVLPTSQRLLVNSLEIIPA